MKLENVSYGEINLNRIDFNLEEFDLYKKISFTPLGIVNGFFQDAIRPYFYWMIQEAMKQPTLHWFVTRKQFAANVERAVGELMLAVGRMPSNDGYKFNNSTRTFVLPNGSEISIITHSNDFLMGRVFDSAMTIEVDLTKPEIDNFLSRLRPTFIKGVLMHTTLKPFDYVNEESKARSGKEEEKETKEASENDLPTEAGNGEGNNGSTEDRTANSSPGDSGGTEEDSPEITEPSDT